MSALLVGRDLPDVMECHGPGDREWALCPQCDGSHRHEWVRCLVPVGGLPDQEATRCRICGGRKCDDEDCLERRHHGGPHLYRDGTLRPVGK